MYSAQTQCFPSIPQTWWATQCDWIKISSSTRSVWIMFIGVFLHCRYLCSVSVISELNWFLIGVYVCGKWFSDLCPHRYVTSAAASKLRKTSLLQRYVYIHGGVVVGVAIGLAHPVVKLIVDCWFLLSLVELQQICECLKLTEEFRQLSDRHANHEDKLQVREWWDGGKPAERKGGWREREVKKGGIYREEEGPLKLVGTYSPSASLVFVQVHTFTGQKCKILLSVQPFFFFFCRWKTSSFTLWRTLLVC